MANDSRKSKLNRQIDENLRRVYDENLQAPVPERFKRLLQDLRERERGAGGAQAANGRDDTGEDAEQDGSDDTRE